MSDEIMGIMEKNISSVKLNKIKSKFNMVLKEASMKNKKILISAESLSFTFFITWKKHIRRNVSGKISLSAAVKAMTATGGTEQLSRIHSRTNFEFDAASLLQGHRIWPKFYCFLAQIRGPNFNVFGPNFLRFWP